MYNGEITSRMLCAGYTEGKVDACQVSTIFLAASCRDVLDLRSFISDLFKTARTVRVGIERSCLRIVGPGGQWGSSGVPG